MFYLQDEFDPDSETVQNVESLPLLVVSPLAGLFPSGGFLLSSKYDPLMFSSLPPLFACSLPDLSPGAVEGRSLPNNSSPSPGSSENLTERLVELGAVSGLARPPRLRDWLLEAAEGM